MTNADTVAQTNEVESREGGPLEPKPPANEPQRSDFFISYSRKDIRFAARLQRDLEAKDCRVWRDETSILPGAVPEKEIRRQIKGSKSVLVILSPSAVKSDYVKGEIKLALDMNKDQHKGIVPILYRTCEIPLNLEDRQCIDFRFTYRAGLAAVLDRSKVIPPPPWWVRFLRRTGVAWPTATLAVLIIILVLLSLPSNTSATLVDKGDTISVRLDNRGPRPSTVVGPYWLRFGTLPVEDAALDRTDTNGNIVAAFGNMEMMFISKRGFKPKKVAGRFRPAREIAASLKPNDHIALEFGVRESDQSAAITRPVSIPSPTIRSFVIPHLPEIVPRGGAGNAK